MVMIEKPNSSPRTSEIVDVMRFIMVITMYFVYLWFIQVSRIVPVTVEAALCHPWRCANELRQTCMGAFMDALPTLPLHLSYYRTPLLTSQKNALQDPTLSGYSKESCGVRTTFNSNFMHQRLTFYISVHYIHRWTPTVLQAKIRAA